MYDSRKAEKTYTVLSQQNMYLKKILLFYLTKMHETDQKSQ